MYPLPSRSNTRKAAMRSLVMSSASSVLVSWLRAWIRPTHCRNSDSSIRPFPVTDIYNIWSKFVIFCYNLELMQRCWIFNRKLLWLSTSHLLTWYLFCCEEYSDFTVPLISNVVNLKIPGNIFKISYWCEKLNGTTVWVWKLEHVIASGVCFKEVWCCLVRVRDGVIK